MSKTVGIACQDDLMNCPYLMKSTYQVATYEEARELLLADPSIQKAKLNDIVMLLSIGA